ncbi:MAG: hypothetical protein KJO21_13680 [Verrucomicrobiae bacterium]|nr:hypothetical protein [Verrucomicrobiae bacterium]NNJ44369.1 hypothetical protein [Akkermansiaceae bacterium]
MDTSPIHHVIVMTTSFLCSSLAANEGNDTLVPLGGEDCDHPNEAVLSISPNLHLRAVYGETDLEDAGLAGGGHDPSSDGFSVPGLSVGIDVHRGEHFFAFTEAIFAWDKEDGWEGELEELYFKWLNLPGGFSLKGGRFFASVGTLNTGHNHEWKFVDTSMMNFRFLGDDSLALEGAEMIWTPPTHWDDQLTLSYGTAVEHAHEEENDAGGTGHGHAEEAEEALWNRDIFTLRYEATFWPADTCGFTYGASYMQGTHFMGKNAKLYGADLTYRWLQDGDHGQKLTWTHEAMLRDVNTEEGAFDEWAFSSRVIWRFLPEWEAGLRYDYLEGVADPELPERHRISPALTRYFPIGKGLEAMARIQYNYDHNKEGGDDHSLWLMFGFDWGDGDDHVH